ncbi:2Fe-2S iron-sulfur cluster-binding protein, partial [Francisella tularensis]|uniref:2Fe-2S iron-sulfur cluster-binding protein n=1 Tax=Francisella tularensis TaxID=263 RepID=UPI002381AF80
MEVRFKIYRDNPEVDKKPYYDEYTVEEENEGVKVLTALELIKEPDPTLALRRSC